MCCHIDGINECLCKPNIPVIGEQSAASPKPLKRTLPGQGVQVVPVATFLSKVLKEIIYVPNHEN